MEKNKLTWLLILGGIVFMLQPIILPAQPDEIGRPVFSMGVLKNIMANALIIAFFYFNYFFLIPRLFFSKKYFRYAVAVAISLFIILSVPSISVSQLSFQKHGNPPPRPTELSRPGPPQAEPEPGPNPPPHSRLWFSRFQDFFSDNDQTFFLFFSIVFFSLLLKVNNRYYKTENAKQKAEINYLLAQINPHFLFNTLNSIYALSIKKDDRASEAIVNLSGLMRYVIKDANDYKIPLEKEIEYLKNYVDLQKARLGNTVRIQFDCSGEPGDKEIAPLILITYIENAFKYGVNPDVLDCVVEITLAITGTGIKLDVFNKKVGRPSKMESTGIGLSNTNERLKHLYLGKHNLKINETAETYSVTLTLDLV